MIGLTDEVHVLRTESNVAHVYAHNELDAHRVQGWVMAKDRYIQVELTRRLGAGTLAEILGDIGLSIDLDSAGRGLRYIGDLIWANLPAETKAKYEAFADGVNTYSEAVRGGQLAVPSELEIVAGFRNIDDPALLAQPMTGKDIAYAAAVIMSQLGYESADVAAETVAQQVTDAFPDGPLAGLRRAGLVADIVDAIAPVHAISQVAPGSHASSTGGLKSTAPDRQLKALKAEATQLERLAAKNAQFRRRLGRPQGQPHGSNSWAVGSKGTGGGALLANDGHLPLSVPSIFYRMCLDAEYFGGEGLPVCGLYFPGLPSMGVGTNGFVAWGQTYLDADLADWYAEEIRLGSDGLPDASRFRGEWMPLQRHEETFRIGADKDPDKFETKTFSRWTTFDGRWLMSVEGRVVTATTTGPVIVLQGDYIAPSDLDTDGVVTGVSLDWTAFDAKDTLAAVDGFARSKSVAEFMEQTKKLVGYGQNIVVADGDGEIMYTGYHALPCREYLERSGDQWAAGSNPRQLLDGTRHGGFDLSGDGCKVPFDVGPRSVSPSQGFVHTANHDPLGNAFDDSLANDQHYIGGPWALGYRANTIDRGLADVTSRQAATVEAMGNLQNNRISPLGLQHTPQLIETIAKAKRLSTTATTSDADGRLVTIYRSAQSRIDDASTRLATWLDRGADAASGVETFYDQPSADAKKDAVAMMIFAAWLRHLVSGVFDDEGVDFAFARGRQRIVFRSLYRMLEGRGAGNPMKLGSFNPDTNESAFFDDRTTAPIETSDEIILAALVAAFDELERKLGRDVDGWLWGLEHKVRFESLLTQLGADEPAVGVLSLEFSITTENLPLAENLERGDPRADLEHFPRGGDYFSVDAAGPSTDSGRYYTYTHGPVMRMVIALDDGKVSGQTILPGGQSGNTRSPQFADQAAKWLGNQVQPIRYHAEDVVEGATTRERYLPR